MTANFHGKTDILTLGTSIAKRDYGLDQTTSLARRRSKLRAIRSAGAITVFVKPVSWVTMYG